MIAVTKNLWPIEITIPTFFLFALEIHKRYRTSWFATLVPIFSDAHKSRSREGVGNGRVDKN